MPETDTYADSPAFEDFAQRLGTYLETRAAQAAEGFAELASYNFETASAQSVNSLTLAPRTTNMFIVKCVVACLPATATGTLLLGTVSIPLTQPLTVIAPLELLLTAVDVRSLTSSLAGPMTLLLTGRQLSPRGLLR